MKIILPDLKLHGWNLYEKVIGGSDNYLLVADALVLIKKAVELSS